MGKVALIIGCTGATGTPLAEQLLRLPDWKVYGAARRVPQFRAEVALDKFNHVAPDLADARAVHQQFGSLTDITHVFYCANHRDANTNTAMLRNVLDAVEQAAPGFDNIALMQGTKYYGCNLGPFKTPAQESDPRVAGCDFYYQEEDLVRERQSGRGWGHTAVRPHSVCGYAAGNPMNLAVVLAIYGAMLRELGMPFGFPASEACYDRLFQVSDADLLARASIWAASTPACRGEAFNITNGQPFRWRELWPALAAFFELPAAGPQPLPLARFLERNAGLWNDMVRRYRLKPFPYERVERWVDGDYRVPNSRFACEYDIVSDVEKARRYGFDETLDNGRMFVELFERFRRARAIP